LGAVALKGILHKAGLRPVASEQCIKFGADSIRDAGQLELEQKYYDHDISLQTVVIDQVIMGNVIGCTRARILLTLMNQKNRENQEPGLASLCIGGGQGMAMVPENVSI
jgi:acetyl-CoA C-acetyltransferase